MVCFLIVSTSGYFLLGEATVPTLRVRGPVSILPQLFNSPFSKLNSKVLIKSERPNHQISRWVRCPSLQCSAEQGFL